MSTQAKPSLIRSYKFFAQVVSVIAIGVGSFALTGWLLDIETLKGMLTGGVNMKPNTAVCSALAGLSLWLLTGPDHPSARRKLVAQVCAVVVVLLGLAILSEYLLQVNLGIDGLLLRKVAPQTPNPGRMSPTTALGFVLLGLTLVFLEVEFRRGYRPGQFLALLAIGVGLLPLVGYMYNVQALYRIYAASPIALHASLLFVLLGFGALFARPDHGLMAIITSEQSGGLMARRILPLALGLPFVIGWLQLLGQQAGLYRAGSGMAIFAVANLVIFTSVVWLSARSLNRVDGERRRAESNDRLKSDFLAGMSHELRTHLNAIIGFTGTLLMKLPGPLTIEQEKQLRTVQSSAKHLHSLINDILDLARIESGKVELQLEPVACQSVIAEVTATLRPAAESKGLKFEVSVPPAEVMVQADRRALSQILINLTNNAIKFTERGSIRLALGQRRGEGRTWTEISVTDTGIGIRPEDQAELFRAFAQISSGVRRRSDSTGLGLHLSQKLAELLGGQITFQSEYGKGSQFTLVL